MFKIYNRSGRVQTVCGQVIPSLETSQPLMDSYYDGNKSRVDRLISLGVIKKIDMPEVDENELIRKQQEEAEEAMRLQEEERLRIEKEIEEMQKAAEKTQQEAEEKVKKEEEVEKKKTEKKETETKKKETETKKEDKEEKKEDK